jgi:phosphoenolpyruvate carboxykinase (GTP)
MAGLNYFLTDEARGGTSKKLLGEKRDVKVWLTWLERHVNKEVDNIETPIGYIPKFDDLKNLFQSIINKKYTEELYNLQFSLYIDNIIARIDLQVEAYEKEFDIPTKLFEVLEEQKNGLMAIRDKFGQIVEPSKLEEYSSTLI